MSGLLHITASTLQLHDAWKEAQPHLRPVILGIKDYGVAMMFVPQGPEAFPLPPGHTRPVVYILSEEIGQTTGPDGFHVPSVRRAIRNCCAFAILACEPKVEIYAAMTAVAILGRHALIVETEPDQEMRWVSLIKKLAPGRPMIRAMVRGGPA